MVSSRLPPSDVEAHVACREGDAQCVPRRGQSIKFILRDRVHGVASRLRTPLAAPDRLPLMLYLPLQ